MKKNVSAVLFVGFAFLCAVEIGPKFLASARLEKRGVLYVRSVEDAPSMKMNTSMKRDYKKLVEDINADGA